MRRLCAALLGAAILSAQNVGYVVDNARGLVHVIDLGARRVTATIPSGAESSEMLVLPSNAFALVSNPAANNVALLDLSNNTRITTIPSSVSPGSLIASADGRFLYVANDASNEVAVIDVPGRRALASIPVEATPVQVNLSPNGRFLYAVNQDDDPTGTISVIDTNRLRVTKTIAVGLRPSQFALSPKLTVAHVVNSGSDNISVVDLGRNEVTGTIPAGRAPSSVAFSTGGRFLYVVNRGSNDISVIDTDQANRVVTRIPVGSNPAAMAVTFDSRYGYVSNQGSNSVTVLDLALNTAEETIAVGSGPFSLMLDPNEDFLYVTNLNSGSVSIIDVNTDSVAATITTGGTPVQFAMLNAPTLLELAPNPVPAGSRMTLNGEGFLPGSTVRFVTATPPRTVTAPVSFLDSQGLEVTVPTIPGASTAVVSVAHADGNSSEQINWRSGTAAPSIFSGGVVEGAGFARAPSPISGGSIVSAFGTFSGALDRDAAGFPLPVLLGNTTVTFNGVPAPLINVRGGQINLVAPIRLLAADRVRVAVNVAGQTSAPETVNVAPVAPGVFFDAASGLAAVLPRGPVRRGQTVSLFVTGLGNTAPPPLDGEPAASDVLSPTGAVPAVTVGGAVAVVGFSGLAPTWSGLYQINFDVPAAAPAGLAPVVVSAGGRSSNAASLAVEP